MISKMQFGVSQVRDYLVANGCVLTVRGYDYATDTAIVPELENIRITRKKVCEIKTAADLAGFLPISSFDTVRDWWRQIKRFCKGRMWLYRVKIAESFWLTEKEQDKEIHAQTRIFADNNAWSTEKEISDITKEPIFDDAPVDEQRTPTEEYNVFSGSLQHPRDNIDAQHEFHDQFMIDLQPSKDAAHADRLRQEARAAERRRDRMRERAGEQQGNIRKTIPARNEQDILVITGNRKLSDPAAVRRQISDIIDARRPDTAISGMAVGADQLFAEICIEKGIPVIAYIPFLGQENRWHTRAQERYRSLLSQCSEKIIVCDSASIQAFQTRNAAMVAASTRAVAVWDRHPGGTANTVRLLNRDSVPYEVIENGSKA